ncbi:MAG: PadR family transcriptional regulator [Oscillospiraceae bacterium]|nr:PadR family transcriptional regulator [Oscillospiraceae bacterium]
MKKSIVLPLTEPMCYVLLALTGQCRGVDIVKQVIELSDGRVVVGPGTVYRLLNEFLAYGLVEDALAGGVARSFRITDKGFSLLQQELARSPLLASDANDCWRDFDEKPQ